MAKKSISKEYLEEKLKGYIEQQSKVTNLLNQYSKLYDKLEGAVEITTAMLTEFEEPKEDDNKTEPGSK